MDVSELIVEGSWGRSLRDPVDLERRHVDLPEGRDFGGWGVVHMADLDLWIPAPGSVQAAVSDDGSSAAIAYDNLVVCVDLAQAVVRHVIRPMTLAFYDMRPVAADRVVVVFDLVIAVVSLTDGLVWEAAMEDVIVDHVFEPEGVRVRLENGAEVFVNPTQQEAGL